jgi:ribonuclease HI
MAGSKLVRMLRSSSNLFPDESAPITQTGWVIAHCDGGARGNPGPAGYGALLQDEAGLVLAQLSEFLGNRTNNYAEYSGLLGCLQWALDHGHRRLRVVSDSELMVKQIQGKYKVNSPDLRPLWEEARRRIAQLDRFEISHALRHKNKAADQLANDAMDRGTGRQRSPAEAPAVSPSPARSAAPSAPSSSTKERPRQAASVNSSPSMLRGFTRDGSIHLLGGAVLPDGIFVKIIPE